MQVIPEMTKHIQRMKAEIGFPFVFRFIVTLYLTELMCDRMEALEKLLSQQTEEVAELEQAGFAQHQTNLTSLYQRKKK